MAELNTEAGDGFAPSAEKTKNFSTYEAAAKAACAHGESSKVKVDRSKLRFYCRRPCGQAFAARLEKTASMSKNARYALYLDYLKALENLEADTLWDWWRTGKKTTSLQEGSGTG
ncbi:hypothetical protein C8Q80DRAFT_1121618 [Daedaleopsis nitida]|nr:hypothetical protein C8Q80DRAFT_1121618 [Daedaleopsis nitida]